MFARPRSRIGIAFSLSYIALFLLTVLALLVSKPDAMSILAPMVLTFPWSFLFLEIVAASLGDVSESTATTLGPIAFVFIFVASAIINAAILYFFGWLLTMLGTILKQGKKIE